MRLSYIFEDREIEAVKHIVNQKLAEKRRAVRFRLQHNVEGQLPKIDDEMLWMAHIMCLLTTQQRSGPNSAINMLLARKPFPLSLSSCRQYTPLEANAFRVLTEATGIRRTDKIAKAIQKNLTLLEGGEWDTLRAQCSLLINQRALPPDPVHRALEESCADYMNQFHEFGPKQSRNFWQFLGLTRHTFVLDSRIIKWLKKHVEIEAGLLTTSGLGDNDYYYFVSNILFDLCTQAGVLPCMLDVAAFDSFDEGNEWADDALW